MNVRLVGEPKDVMGGRISGSELLLVLGATSAVTLLPPAVTAIGAAGIGAGLLLLRYPWLIWPMTALVLPFAAAEESGPVAGSDLLLALGAALWFADGVRRRRLRLNGTFPTALVIVYALVLSLASLQALDLGEAGKEVVKWVELAVLLLLVPAMMPRRWAPWLVAGLLMGGVLQALLGVAQFVLRIGPEWFVLFDRFMRASGTFAQPNPYAGYLGLTLPAAVSLAVWAWGNLLRTRGVDPVDDGNAAQSGHHAVRASAMALALSTAAGLIALGLAASWSRGGWIGAAAGIGVVLLFRSRMSMAAGTVAGLCLLAAVMVGQVTPSIIPAPLAARFAEIPVYIGAVDVAQQPLTDENFSVIERLAHWEAALRMWERAPWWGIGPGNYATVYPDVRLPRWEEALGHAHNIYLNVLAESGIVGLTGYLALWGGTALWLIGRRRRQRHPSWEDALTLGVLGVVAHLTIHNGFDNLFVQGIYLHIGLWLAAVGVSTSALETTAKFAIRRESYRM